MFKKKITTSIELNFDRSTIENHEKYKQANPDFKDNLSSFTSEFFNWLKIGNNNTNNYFTSNKIIDTDDIYADALFENYVDNYLATPLTCNFDLKYNYRGLSQQDLIKQMNTSSKKIEICNDSSVQTFLPMIAQVYADIGFTVITALYKSHKQGYLVTFKHFNLEEYQKDFEMVDNHNYSDAPEFFYHFYIYITIDAEKKTKFITGSN